MNDNIAGHWRAVFDIAVGSMDFGSGFLDDEEVQMLRAAAVDLGVDPMEATPSDFKSKYCPGYEDQERLRFDGLTIHLCKHCGQDEGWHTNKGEGL